MLYMKRMAYYVVLQKSLEHDLPVYYIIHHMLSVYMHEKGLIPHCDHKPFKILKENDRFAQCQKCGLLLMKVDSNRGRKYVPIYEI